MLAPPSPTRRHNRHSRFGKSKLYGLSSRGRLFSRRSLCPSRLDMLASELEERHSGSAERTPMPMFAELVSPERLVFSGEVESILLPGVEGDMTILPGHAPLITMLNPGVVLARDTAGQARRAFVRGGVVEVTGSKVTILAERVAAIEEVTTEFLDAEILQLEMTRDASMDQTARIQANIAIARLEEFKGSLNLIKAT